jgi:hypothetical protein
MEIVEKIEGFLKNETRRNEVDDSSNKDKSLHLNEEEK